MTDFTASRDVTSTHFVGPVSFIAKRGEVVVIRGSSGSGKSTIAAALVGFIRSRSGTFFLDSIDTQTISPASVRRVVGLCEQQPHIFAETIRHNLDFARDTAVDDELWEVLERVGLADWARARDGLETFLGEAGMLISGGQAQRLALARILLADRDVVVLDEPTANLNRELADQVMRDVLRATADRIVIVFSHTDVPFVRKTTEIFLD